MSSWYQKSFGREYLRLYPHRDAVEAREDIRKIVDLITPPKDALLLDLACGAGRHLLALYEMGFPRLAGLDLSEDLLREAKGNLQRAGATRVALVRGDMREIPWNQCFTTVLLLFTSFGYFEEDEENRKVFQAVFRAMNGGGNFLIDYLNRDHIITNLVPQDEKRRSGLHIESVRNLTEGNRRVEKTIRVTSPGGEERAFHESVRLFSPAEMERMLSAAGFVRIRRFGSLLGEPFGPQSKRLILVGTKPEKGGSGD